MLDPASISYAPGEFAEKPVPNGDGSCVVIGPARSGKTTLLLAIHQACLQPGETDQRQQGENPYQQHAGDGYKLDFVPESESTSALVGLAGEFLFRGKTVQASREVMDYSFSIFLSDLRQPGPELSRQITVTDGPGGYLFPGEGGGRNAGTSAWHTLLSRARDAQNLVLCVDGSNPGVDVLYNGLPELILGLKGDSRRLPYLRVLLLITKIDKVIDGFCRGTEESGAGLGPSWRPALIARMLDPVAQTRQLLGNVIEVLRGSLSSNAILAVGVCSALGFDGKTGNAFASTILTQAADRRVVADRLRDWEPFGVREVILFLLAGVIQHPLAEVRPASAGFDGRFWNVRVPIYV